MTPTKPSPTSSDSKAAALGSGIILSLFNLIGGSFIGCVGGNIFEPFAMPSAKLTPLMMLLDVCVTSGFSIYLCLLSMDQARPGWYSKYWPLFLVAFAIPVIFGSYIFRGSSLGIGRC